MSCLNIADKMHHFYLATKKPLLIPVVGPLVISPLTTLIGLVDLAVSKIFSLTKNATPKEIETLSKRSDGLLKYLQLHVINTVSLGIIPWALIIHQLCRSKP